MKGLSAKEMEIVAHLEFEKRYFFTREDISRFFSTKNQMRHTLHKLQKKERIIRLNKDKYYLVPIRAPSGRWAENSFAIADEVMDGEDYFIGGWAAANHWRLTDQIPMKIEVYSTKRQGRKRFLTTDIIFRRTTQKRLKNYVVKEEAGHPYRILNKEEASRWIKLRE